MCFYLKKKKKKKNGHQGRVNGSGLQQVEGLFLLKVIFAS